ncbi:MAG: hypothetical protein KJO69_04605 [Gammaproteobacteria bacterium]|nr:hypothetical protein [Gammaproteobacteria bacterium]NNJ73045.1 hypothetical protein [Enterobacterales bacterium]
MPISETLSLVGVLLLLCFGVIVVYSKHEKAKSKRLQEISSYKFKAEEAQDLHDSLASLGLHKAVYKILLQRVVINYDMAFALDGGLIGVKQRLLAAKEALSQFEQAEYYSELPSTTIALQRLINKMVKLVKYVNTLHENRAIPDGVYLEIMTSLQQNLLRLNAEGHMKIAHQALSDGQLGSARQSYEHAKATLLEFDPNASYVQEHLATINAVLEDLAKQEAEQLHQDDPNKQQTEIVEEQLPDSDTTLTKEEQQMHDAALSQAELNRLNEKTGGHEVKKKW